MRPFCLARIKDENGGCDCCLVDNDVSEKNPLAHAPSKVLEIEREGDGDLYKTRGIMGRSLVTHVLEIPPPLSVLAREKVDVHAVSSFHICLSYLSLRVRSSSVSTRLT